MSEFYFAELKHLQKAVTDLREERDELKKKLNATKDELSNYSYAFHETYCEDACICKSSMAYKLTKVINGKN